jgi:predicted ferric reductase
MRFRQHASTTESYLLTNGVAYTFVLAYGVSNVLLFLYTAQEEYGRHTDFQRVTTSIARGCGAILNLNLAAVLLVASRSLVAFLRETPLALIVSFDALMPGAHAVIGSLIVIAGFIHAGTHWATYIAKRIWSPGLDGYTSLFVTGMGLCLVFSLIRLSAWESIRRKHYEIFRRIHVGGSIIAFALLCVHGFHRGVPSTWKWVLGPALIYSVDYAMRVMREKRSYIFVNKHSAIFQGQSVLRLRLPRVFHFQAGQYAELKVPAISKAQWHPFTIASAPHEAEMVFYVKAAGDWTTELFQLFANRLREGYGPGDDIEVHIRGPFSTPATKFDQFEHLILIGGGVGATPFCSVVKSLHYWMTHWSPNPLKPLTMTRMRNADGQAGNDIDIPIVNTAKDKNLSAATRTPFSGMKSTTRIQNLLGSTIDVDQHASLLDRATTFPTSFYTAYTHAEEEDLSTARSLTSNISGVAQSSEIEGELTKYSAVHQSAPELPVIHWTNMNHKASACSLDWAASIRDNRDLLLNPASDQRCDAEARWDQLSLGSRRPSVSAWTAIQSLYEDNRIGGHCQMYQDSLNMMIGMSYGSVALARGMQMQKARRLGGEHDLDKVEAISQKVNIDVTSDSTIAYISALTADNDLSIFYNWRFLALVYARSVTVNLALMWLLIIRCFIAGFATLFDEVSLLRNGLTIYKSIPLLVIDTVLATVIALGVGLPALLEFHELGAALLSWMDLLALTPAVVFGVITNSLAIAGIGQGTNLIGMLTLIVVWPGTALLFLVRLVRVVGDRVALGGNLRRTPANTRSVDFYWTASTQEDDGWLVDELLSCASSKRTHLHRYITRSQPRHEAWMERLDDGTVPPFQTMYGRPDWDELFNGVAERAQNGTTVGVFLCGPDSMTKQVEQAAVRAMRNSIVRGLQRGAHPMRSLEEVFGNSISANMHTGDDPEETESQECGINVTFIVSIERFS